MSWSQIEARRKAVAFAEDLAEWRRLFGEPARFSAAAGGEAERCRRAIEFLGFSVVGNGVPIETERRGDAASMRRQRFLDALGTPTASFLGRLRDGETVTVSAPDATVPLPYGLEAWRRTLASRDVSKDAAFVAFLRDVRASRMLVALDALDPETRDGLRDAGDPAHGWRTLYVEALEGVSRFPEALRVRDGRLELPGGAEADPLWKATVGAPAAGASFWSFYTQNQGKAAYVADSLWHMRDEEVRRLSSSALAPDPTRSSSSAASTRRSATAAGFRATLTTSRIWRRFSPPAPRARSRLPAPRARGSRATRQSSPPCSPDDPRRPCTDDAALRRLLQRARRAPATRPCRGAFFSFRACSPGGPISPIPVSRC